MTEVYCSVLEAGKSKIRMLADSVSGEGLLGLQTVIFLLCPHTAGEGGISLEPLSLGAEPTNEDSTLVA